MPFQIQGQVSIPERYINNEYITYTDVDNVPDHLFPSRVSGGGYKIGPVCVCVRLSVC